jgi:LuxR family transcriptional regulator, maltose regulon positive regulatory protein
MATHAAQQVMRSSRRPAAFTDDPILASKITAPEVPGWALPRQRITTMIIHGTRWCPLTVVTGPLGGGKTMALALWAAAETRPVAWLSLDAYDNRPGVFWSYVVAALHRSGAAISTGLSVSVPGRQAEHLFLLRLASVLAAQNPPVTLVLDDFHLITEPRLLNGLDFLLRNAGAGLRLLVSSRADPRLPLHRYLLAGELAEIRAGDLAFSVTEAGRLLKRHGCTLKASSLGRLTRETEGWAAGLRLAAISMAGHPAPDQLVHELVTEDSALTGYLMQEVFDAQPPQVRELLLSTSILEHVNAEAASELAGCEQAGQILAGLAHANAFVQPAGGGWYRYHTLFAEMLRLRLRHQSQDVVAALHRRAARWCERNGQLTDAVRHAVKGGDWQLAASMAIEALAIGEIIEPAGSPSLAEEFAGMPGGEDWPGPQPYLVSAAIELSAGRPEPAAAALDAAEEVLGRLPAGRQDAAWLAAAMVRLAVSRHNGDLTAAAEAAARAEALVSKVPDGKLARRPHVRVRVLSAGGDAALWLGRFSEAARVFGSAVTAAAATGQERERLDCLGRLALVEALRGRLDRAAELAHQATAARPRDGQQSPGQRPDPAALAALAWVHLERLELRSARSRLKQVDAALGVSPDKLIGALACLVAACDAITAGQVGVAAQFVAKARSGWPVPAWLDQRLNLAESRALTAAGAIEAALAAAKRAGCDGTPEAAVTLAHAWVAAGDSDNARCALAPVLAAGRRAPAWVRLQACLVDARLGYHTGDDARGRRSLVRALRLADGEQLKLPFALERGWIEPVLRRDPDLAHACRHLSPPALPRDQLPAPPANADQATFPPAEPLTEREREVLRHVSGMLTTAEIAEELYISTNTVKSHIKNVCHKLAVAHRGQAVRRARQLQLI